MKKLFLLGIIISGLSLSSCIKVVLPGKDDDSSEKTVQQDQPVAQAQPAATAPAGTPGAHYTMLDGGAQPAPSPATPAAPADAPAAPAANSSDWHKVTFTGFTSVNGKRFPIRITAQSRTRNGQTEYKSGYYTNVNFNVTFPVRITQNYDRITIVNSKSDDDVYIEAYRNGGGWDGTMTADGHTITLHMN